MGSAINSVMGGGGGGLLGSIGGIVGGIFGGPIGAMIGQAVGNLLQQSIGNATNGAIDELQQEHGLPKFLADQIKDKISEVIDGLQNKDVSADATDAAQSHFGDDLKSFEKKFQDNLVKSVLDSLGDEDTKDSQTKGNGASKNGKSGSTTSSGGWLMAIAKAMGKALGDKAANMVHLSDKMSQLSQDQTKGARALEGMDSKSKEAQAQKNTNDQNAREYNETMTQFQAAAQDYNMLNNVFSTAIKSMGESLSAMARKQ